MKLGAAMGLGVAYATSNREEFKEILAELINDENLPVEVSANAAIALSLIFVGNLDDDVINTLLTSMMIFSENTLNKPIAKFFAVALSLNFLGTQNQCETTIEALSSIDKKIAK